jgi:integrase
MASLRKRGATWYVRVRDEHGKQSEIKAGPDRSVAQRIAAEAESRVQAIKAGAIDPRERTWADAERRPLADHVEDWYKVLLARRSNATYAATARSRVLRLIEMTRATRISHISLSGVQTAVGALRSSPRRPSRSKPLSDRTVHHHVRAITSFTTWLWRDGRVREDPLAHLAAPKVVTSKERRALSPQDTALLIATTRTGPTSYGLSGEDRATLYALALGTGFRVNELRSLTPEDFDLDADPPTVTCRAAYTKNRAEAVQPIRPDLAAVLRPWVSLKPRGEIMFGLLSDTSNLIRRDLAAAGLPTDTDFHSLRHTYVTNLVMSGTPIKVVQALARHSSAALTLGIYSHVGVYDLARGLEGLPTTAMVATPQVVRATGTDGAELAHTLPTELVSGGRKGTGCTYEKPAENKTLCVPSRHARGTSKPLVAGSNPAGRALSCKDLGQNDPTPADTLSHTLPTDLPTTPPDDLSEVIRGWDALPTSVRAEIVARVRSALGQGGDQ